MCSSPFCLHSRSYQSATSNTTAAGISAVLLQRRDGIEWRVLAYASRKLLPRESRYSTIERELLAVTFGLSIDDAYVYGNEILLENVIVGHVHRMFVYDWR